MFAQQRIAWNQADKHHKSKYLLSLVMFLSYLIILIGLAAWLAVLYHQSFDYVGQHFAPGKDFADKVDPNWKDYIDIFGTSEAPTYGEIYTERGQEGFAWFYLTSGYPIAIAPYVLLPIFAILTLWSFGYWIFQYRNVFPPVTKTKKAKKAKKNKKAPDANLVSLEGGHNVIS